MFDLSAMGAVRGLKSFSFFLIGKESVLLLLAGWMVSIFLSHSPCFD